MLNSASIIGRYTLTGTVKLMSPLIIRAGVSNDILNDTVDDIVVTYHDGQPFIPGTSLAGVLRQALQGLVPDAELVLFGSIDDKGTQSALQINDIPLEDTNIVVRDGIRIDDVRGVTVDGAKYDFEVIESGATVNCVSIVSPVVVTNNKARKWIRPLLPWPMPCNMASLSVLVR